ncbi:BTB (POZ) domain-containing protein [Balamuthia mandrillaris]
MSSSPKPQRDSITESLLTGQDGRTPASPSPSSSPSSSARQSPLLRHQQGSPFFDHHQSSGSSPLLLPESSGDGSPELVRRFQQQQPQSSKEQQPVAATPGRGGEAHMRSLLARSQASRPPSLHVAGVSRHHQLRMSSPASSFRAGCGRASYGDGFATNEEGRYGAPLIMSAFAGRRHRKSKLVPAENAMGGIPGQQQQQRERRRRNSHPCKLYLYEPAPHQQLQQQQDKMDILLLGNSGEQSQMYPTGSEKEEQEEEEDQTNIPVPIRRMEESKQSESHVSRRYGRVFEQEEALEEEEEDDESEEWDFEDYMEGLEDTAALFCQLKQDLGHQWRILQREKYRLKKDYEALDAKIQTFEEIKQQMQSVLQIQHNRVKLNVGGVKFVTSLDTLLMYPDSMLGNMFSGRYNIEKDEKGYFFIDRDGTHFRHILNFLRTGSLVLPDDPSIVDELRIEAEFYQIKPLLEALSQGLRTQSLEFSPWLVHPNIVLSPDRKSAYVATKGTCRVLLHGASVYEGRHYWEIRLESLQNPNCIAIGVTRTSGDLGAYVGSSKDGWSCIVMNRENMKRWNSPVCENYGKGGIFQEGDHVGILLDYTASEKGDKGVLAFYVNGVYQGPAFNDVPPHVFPAVALHSKGDKITLVPSHPPDY